MLLYVQMFSFIEVCLADVSPSLFQITVSKSSEGTVSSELTIAQVNWDDGGLYSCVAREVVGGGGRGVDVAAAAHPKMQKIFLDVFSGAKG